MEEKGKRVVCNFINAMCGVDSGDINSADGQCECLLSAIIV